MIESIPHMVDRVGASFPDFSTQLAWLALFANARRIDTRAAMPDGSTVTMAEFAVLHGNVRLAGALEQRAAATVSCRT